MHADERIRITLVDNQRIMRDGLRALFRNQADMDVVGEAEFEAEAIELARELRPDVVILNVNMPSINGINTTQQISQELPEVKIIALSMCPRKDYVSVMLKAGVSGYVLKNHNFSELIKAIYAVVEGETYLCPKTTSIVIGDYVRSRSGGDGSSVRNCPGAGCSSDEALTDRERKVLELLSDGKSSKEIARIIHKSVKTVDARRRRIMHKLDTESVTELVKYAIRTGITSI